MEEIFNLKAVSATMMGIVSMICVFSCSQAAGFGFIVSVVGLIVGCSARRETKSKLAYVATLLNVICLGVCVIGFALFSVSGIK